MTWYAKPKGSYGVRSTEGLANIWEMVACFPAWTDEAKAACIGNSVHEGGLNPWRWQYDSESSIPNLGYGLFQYSPGEDYCMIARAKPNLSTTHQTPDADPTDGAIQCEVLATNELGKWKSDCWRSYWNENGRPKYPELWTYRQEVLNRWGSGTSISLAQFGQCGDVDAATFIFLACFEGPKIPNYTVRKNTANDIYYMITGTTPPPTPPTPDPPTPPDPVSPVPIPTEVLMCLLKKRKHKSIFKC